MIPQTDGRTDVVVHSDAVPSDASLYNIHPQYDVLLCSREESQTVADVVERIDISWSGKIYLRT